MKNMSNIQKEDLVRIAITSFDFGKVHRIMLLLNWKWIGGRVPTITELRVEAARLLRGVIMEDGCIAKSCGGLRAYKTDSSLELDFVLEQSFALFDKEDEV